MKELLIEKLLDHSTLIIFALTAIGIISFSQGNDELAKTVATGLIGFYSGTKVKHGDDN